VSRIGKKPIVIPKGVEVTIADRLVTVKGPNGTQQQEVRPEVEVKVDNGHVVVEVPHINRRTKSFWGLYRTLIQNMIGGVSDGFTKVMEIIGVGYRAEVIGSEILFSLGYSHPIIYPLPDGISASIDKALKLTLKGFDKQLLGQVAADIRALRPPEPYKGKGIKYLDETIIRKVGKAG